MPELPSGTVTFLFTDIEGSTQRWEHDAAVMSGVRARHETILRAVIAEHGGFVFKGTGDGVLASFTTAPVALQAALAAQRALFAEDWGPGDPLRVRIALHTGTAELRDGDYFGPTMNRASRILSAGHGGQTLISGVTEELIRDSLPPDVALQDMGEVRLKDLSRPQHLFQIVAPDLPSEFAPLKTLDPRRTNLPAQTNMLVGREHEAAEVFALLHREDVRLVTLIGPGGTGKTRLSLEVAAESADRFPDGVYFIPLENVVDPARVTSQIAETLSVTEGGSQSLITRLYAAVRNQRLLLVLDNFEQVTSAGPALSQLLGAAPGIKALVTSRSALHIYGEREYLVPPLPLPNRRRLPPIEQLVEYEAVRLFVARAQEVRADFALTPANARAVVEICERLDGLPLAIELAAARIKLLTPQALLKLLTGSNTLQVLTGGARDLPARQQTMRGGIDWSYLTLPPDEQALFARMAIFAGGGTLAAIEAIGNPSGDLRTAIIDALSSLADKSLLRQEEGVEGEPRFVMLGTIREYALERLAERGETATVRRAHAAYYVALVEEAEQYLAGGALQGMWLRQLEEEHDNVRAAVRGAIEAGERETAVRLVGVFWRYWSIRGYLTEGRHWIERALENAADVPPPLRVKALDGLASLMRSQGDEAAARERYEESLALARAIGDQRLVAHALSSFGRMALDAGDYDNARRFYEECLAIRRAIPDSAAVARTLNNLGITAQRTGDTATARARYEESLTLARLNGHTEFLATPLTNLGALAQQRGEHAAARARYEEGLAVAREMGDTGTIGSVLNNLGAVARQQGDLPAARAFYEQSLALRRELGNVRDIAFSLTNLGLIALDQGDAAAARAYFDECLAMRRELGDPRALPFSLNNVALAARQQSDYAAAREAYQESLTVSQQLADPRGVIEALEGFAGLIGAQGDGERAARLWGAVETQREARRLSRVAEEREQFERERDAVRAQVDAAAWERAWAAGRAMTLTQAIESALAPVVTAPRRSRRSPPPGVPEAVPPASGPASEIR